MSTPDGWLELFTALRARLTRLVLRIAPPEEVEDIVQETYVRVCQIECKDAIRQPRSFLFRTAQNLALDHVRRAETRLTSPSDTIDEMDFSPEVTAADPTYAKVSSDEEFAQFCEAVRRLPQQCRRAFVLKRVYGHSQREIAEIMGISENVVEKHLARGVRRCEVYLDEIQRPSSQEKGSSALPTRHRSTPTRSGS